MPSRQHLITATAYDKRGRLLARATNNYRKTHPLQAHFASLAGEPERQYLHAELAVLLRCKDVVPHEIRVERYKRDGSPANAAPCPVCKLAIKQWGVQRVIFTED